MGRKPAWKLEQEKPVDKHDRSIPVPDWVINQTVGQQPAANQLEALIMTAPGAHEPYIVPTEHQETWASLDTTLGVQLNLTEEERDILSARYVAGLTVRDTASILGIPKSTVSRIELSALDRIRKRINNHTLATERQIDE
jgi:RNA polymerase sigma factor (sigma-70 family)